MVEPPVPNSYITGMSNRVLCITFPPPLPPSPKNHAPARPNPKREELSNTLQLTIHPDIIGGSEHFFFVLRQAKVLSGFEIRGLFVHELGACSQAGWTGLHW